MPDAVIRNVDPHSGTAVSGNPKWMTWTGWVLTVLPAAMLIMSATMKLMKSKEVTDGFSQMGFPDIAIPLGIVELVATILFLIPRTAVLGAVLITGYLGGAICTHVRMSDAFIMPAAMGVVVWLALYLREPRLRPLLPLRN